ncbi:MAG TPA: hypothetical protein EYG88_13360 [Desulfocapsa sulfexigens]|nr:hypothetical protein [Desulfocapsa sulfexigens]
MPSTSNHTAIIAAFLGAQGGGADSKGGRGGIVYEVTSLNDRDGMPDIWEQIMLLIPMIPDGNLTNLS